MIALSAMTVSLTLLFGILMVEEFECCKVLPWLTRLSAALGHTKMRRNAYICCFVTIMAMSR